MTILIVDARFYEDIADELLKGATEFLSLEGIKYENVSVPGVFEVAPAISFASKSGKYDGYIALGCVIRGETSHYDYVCSENARGLTDLALEHDLAIGYGVLTVENKKQAMKRAGVKEGNKGKAAAEACIRMIELKKQFGLV